MGSLAAKTHDSLVIETDVLICGTGPAGASLACFLASHGRYFISTYSEFHGGFCQK